MPYRVSGNYASDEAKEIARLKRELRDAKDAINVLKQASRKSPSRETPFFGIWSAGRTGRFCFNRKENVFPKGPWVFT